MSSDPGERANTGNGRKILDWRLYKEALKKSVAKKTSLYCQTDLSRCGLYHLRSSLFSLVHFFRHKTAIFFFYTEHFTYGGGQGFRVAAEDLEMRIKIAFPTAQLSAEKPLPKLHGRHYDTKTLMTHQLSLREE